MITLVICTCLAVSITDAAYTYAKENALRTEIFVTNQYNKAARSEPNVRILCGIRLLSVKEISTRDQTMKSTVLFSFQWSDTRLEWASKPAYNSDIVNLYSTESTLFTPAIVVENSVSDVGIISDTTMPMRISQSGAVAWTPGGIYETHCDIDTTFYPFDKQTCDVIITTRGYIFIELKLRLQTNPIDMSSFSKNGEWEYVESAASLIDVYRGSDQYSQITYKFTFQRRTTYHIMATIIPMSLLAFMSSFVFKLPLDAGEKIGYSLTVLLAFAVYLTLVSDNIPTTSTNVSFLSVYLLLMLSMSVLAVLFSIYIIDCHFTPDDEDIPKFLYCLTSRIACTVCWRGRKCCCHSSKTKVSKIDIDKKKEIDMDSWTDEEKLTWQNVAKIWDIFLFRFYVFFVTVLSALFMITMYVGSLYI